MSKDTLHEGRRWIGQQLKLKKRRGTKLTYGELELKHSPDELQQLVFGRSGGGDANDELVQIVKNETLIALIRRNAGVVPDACMPAGRVQRQATSSSHARVASARKDDL